MTFHTLQTAITSAETRARDIEKADEQASRRDPSPEIRHLRHYAHLLRHIPLETLVKLPPCPTDI